MRSSIDYKNLKKVIGSYIVKHKTPTRASNINNLVKLKTLDPATNEAQTLKDTIILSNGGFVMNYVMKYHNLLNDDASINELFQEAMIGVMESIDSFDVSRNTSFTTYAYFHVRKRIIDFIKHNKLIRAPRDVARNIKHVTEVIESLFAKDGTTPSALEVKTLLLKSKDIKLNVKIVEDIMILIDLNSSGFEDSFISEYKDHPYESEESELFKKMKVNILSQIEDMDEIKKSAISLRFGLDYDFSHTAEEITLILGLKTDLGIL